MINPSATARSILSEEYQRIYRTSTSSKPRSFDCSPMLDFDDRNFLSNTSTFHPDLETVKYFVKKAI
ncbi:hypothetical protein ALC57_16018 [Trachymyrmex cornetzi]|uniref:Uncharacterized protein n=1 Tax=Trachymyrmex cornetzi TaxID=471704 RepID=A0A195DGB2_9HYME|nr:hypothetical protein ALC57_16018 [Trachymyrmex cornetzi]